jgi:hypothetical protein
MNFFSIKTSWSNLEIGLIKICVGSLYIMVGIYFHEFLKNYLLFFGIVFFVTAIWTGYLWLRKMKEAN